jgi:hypothetical protein
MFFPYLRGKQYEILALRDLLPLLNASGRIVPIVEPVRASQNDNLVRIVEAGAPLLVIENPEKGDYRQQARQLRALLADRLSADNVTVGFLVKTETERSAIEAFMNRNVDRETAFVHFGSFADPEWLAGLDAKYNVFLEGRSSIGYRDRFPTGGRVILEDSFERRPRNEGYPPNEFYSDTHERFGEEGIGFGDFSIQGNYYTETGGQALAVAIHFVNREPSGELWVRHFLSDRTRGRGVDTPGKFREALRKTVRFINSSDNWLDTEGSEEFIDLNRREHFPGLGFVKKVSIKHHIELVDAVLAETRDG